MAERTTHKERFGGLPPLLVRYWFAMVAMTVLSAVYTAVRAWHWGMPAPYGLDLLWGDLKWGDLLAFAPGFLHFGEPGFWSHFDYPMTYPAPLGVLFAVLYRFPHPVRTFMLMMAPALLAGAWLGAHALRVRGVSRGYAWAFTVSTILMTWPLIVEIDTENVEALVVVVLAGGVLAVVLRRWWLGATLIGLAGSMKIFPLVLLGLLLSKRRYKEFAWALVFAALVVVASLKFLGPSIVEAQRHINAGMPFMKTRYFFFLGRMGGLMDHSLWRPVRMTLVALDRSMHPLPAEEQAARTAALLELWLRIYIAATASAGTVLYFLRIRRLPVLNQVIALTVCAVLLPPLSIEYTLLHLLLPFGMLCAYTTAMWRRGETVRGLGACLACFAVIFNVESFLSNRYTYASEARLLALIVLLLLVLRYRFERGVFDPAGQE